MTILISTTPVETLIVSVNSFKRPHGNLVILLHPSISGICTHRELKITAQVILSNTEVQH